jgi:hypothetical protein
MDMTAAVHKAFENMVTTGAVATIIEQHLMSCVQSAVKDALSSYGDFGKMLKEQVAKSLTINENLGLPEYNDLILKIIRKQVDAQIGAQLQRNVAEQLAKLLETPPAEIKLSKLFEEFREYAVDHYARDEESHFTVGMKNNDYRDGSYDVWFDLKRDRSQFQSAHRVGVDADGCCWRLTVDNEDANQRLFLGPLFGFERLLFQIKVGGTKIIRDCTPDDVDTEYPDRCHCD